MKRLLTVASLVVAGLPFLAAAPAVTDPCVLPDAAVDGERKDYLRLANSCVKCHADVTAEHQGSAHASSWTDPLVQAAIKADPSKADGCARCHAPREILDVGIGKLPEARTTARELGVTCITCHMKKNDYFGPYASKGHGGVEASAFYRESTMCAGCHGQPEARKEHEQFSSFLKGPAAKDGATCQSCHMPEVTRELVTDPKIRPEFKIGAVPARKHTFGGVRKGSLLAQAAALGVEPSAEGWRIGITPKTGHALPASYGRRVRLTVEQRGDGEKPLKTDVFDFVAPETALAPGASSTHAVAKVSGVVSAKAVLTHHAQVAPGRDAEEVGVIATLVLPVGN